MNKQDIIKSFNEIINYKVYNSNKLNKELTDKENNIIDSINNKEMINYLEEILNNTSQELEYAAIELLLEYVNKINISLANKFDVLNGDLPDSFKINIWKSLNKKDKDTYFSTNKNEVILKYENSLKENTIANKKNIDFNNLDINLYKDYDYLKAYKMNDILKLINNYFSEDDKIDLLRNTSFIQDTPSYTLEMILNNMYFNAVFNMLQNKELFNKVNNIDVNINEKDLVLIPGYLDSPRLVVKTNHNMINELLNNVNKDNLIKYLNLPYIYNKLSNKEMINLAINKNINILNLLIERKINNEDLINYINGMWEQKLDYNLINNVYFKENVLNMDPNVNFDEVIYLFDKISTYDVITIQETKKTVNSFKSVLSFYLTFGLKEALLIAEQGNKNVKLNDVKRLGKRLVGQELYNYKLNNANIFDNMTNKIINLLNNMDKYESLKNLVEDSPYLKNVISLAKIYNYGNAFNIMEDYLEYKVIDENIANIKLYRYVHGLVNNIYLSQRELKQNNFNNFILQHFKIKESANYNRKKELCNQYIKNLKLKVLISTLLSNNKNNYQVLFKDNYKVNDIIQIYTKFISKENIEIKNVIKYILIPLANNEFSYENTLSNLGIKVSKYFKLYLEEEKENDTVSKINKEVKKMILKYNEIEKIQILNYICYGTELINIKESEYKTFRSIHDELSYLSGNITFNKINFNIEYQHNVILSNEDDLLKYQDYIKIIDRIINKTNTFVNCAIKTEQVKNIYKNEIDEYLNKVKINYKLNSHNYETRKQVFNLANIEKIFEGYNVNANIQNRQKFNEIFINNNYLAMAGDGYFDFITPKFGYLMAHFDEINKYIEDNKIDNSNFDIFDYYKLYKKATLKLNPVGESIDDSIINNVCVNNISLKETENTYQNMLKRYLGSVPFINGCVDNIRYELSEYHNQNLLTSNYPASVNNKELHNYLCLNENGFYFNFYDIRSNKLIGNIMGIRNGNVLYLSNFNYINEKVDLSKAINDLGNKIIKSTNNEEPINFVILNSDSRQYYNGIKVNDQIINNINCPFINKELNVAFNDQETILIAANEELAKDNIKYYKPNILYPRNRNDYRVISNLATNEDINNVNAILYQFLGKDFNPLDMKDYKELIYGDDWFIAKKFDNTFDIVDLNYDPRAEIEINEYLNKQKNKTKSIVKVA